MAKKKKEVAEKTTKEQVEQTIVEETPQIDKSKFESAEDDSVVKIDLSKPPTPKEDEIKENNPDNEGVVAVDDNADTTEKQEEVQSEEQAQEQPIIEEVTEEEVKDKATELTEELLDAKVEEAETGTPLPENLQKVVDFMEETGGTLEDYVNLNQDFSKYDDTTILREYYKQTKSHLSNEEIDFLIDDSFSYDEEVDEDREIRKKKIALKEQVASAKAHLDGQKSKYYEEVKAGSRLTPEQQKAMDFFNRYNKESEEETRVVQQQQDTFINQTNQVFNNDFKGFEYQVGDKKYRFNVKNPDEVKTTQSDINNFVGKFLNKNYEMEDAKGYHKSLFTAMNPDAIANHFYEQGKADAMKNSIAKAKNVDMNPRQSHSEVNVDGMKFKVLSDDTSPTFKFKTKINK
jgi:hypothetical protein